MAIFQMTMVKRIDIYCSNKNFKAACEVITKGISQKFQRLHVRLLLKGSHTTSQLDNICDI